MPTCHECGDSFPNRARVQGKVRVLNSRKRCLSCSPWGTHNTSRIGRKRRNVEQAQEWECTRCKHTLPIGDFYICKDGRIYSYCKGCDCKRQTQRKRDLKEVAVSHFGGSCVRCGYSRHVSGLDFHHTHPKLKDFSLSHYTKGLQNGALTGELKKELEKCELVCACCHREIHAGVRPFSLGNAFKADALSVCVSGTDGGV